MLRKNVRTDDCLVNVACGAMTGFRWSQGNSSTAQPDGIEVKLDIEDVGKQGQLHGDEGTEPSSTVMYTMTARFQSTNGQHTLERYQFPLVRHGASPFIRCKA